MSGEAILQEFEKRLDLCIACGGGYFEGVQVTIGAASEDESSESEVPGVFRKLTPRKQF